MIEKIDNRLWQVRDLLPQDKLDVIVSMPWDQFAWRRESKQEDWPRKRIDGDIPEVVRVTRWIQDCLPTINQALGTEYVACSGLWWLDCPGFTCAMHTDGHLPNSMQLYWIAPSNQYGTGFYHFKDSNSLKYQFLSVPNSGYIMLNEQEPNQWQPLQWHGMFNPVPTGTYRLSSYFYFYK